MTTTEPTRARLIHTRGDGQDTFRTVTRYAAVTTVYIAPEGARRADQGDDPSITLTIAPTGGWKLAHELGGWGQVPPTVLASGHVDRLPAVLASDTPDQTMFAWVVAGEIYRGPVSALASWAVDHKLGIADEPVPATVYAPTDTGALVPVPVRVECGEYDPRTGWADLMVTVDLGNGVTVTGADRVDGRA